ATRTVHYPEGASDAQKKLVQDVLLREFPPQAGVRTAYFRKWYGRIVDHYRGSGTKLIFVRVPRAPVIPPGNLPPRMDSAVRQLGSTPDVVVMDENHLNDLERPELFGDPLHLNGEGQTRFSHILARDCRKILGPPK